MLDFLRVTSVFSTASLPFHLLNENLPLTYFIRPTCLMKCLKQSHFAGDDSVATAGVREAAGLEWTLTFEITLIKMIRKSRLPFPATRHCFHLSKRNIHLRLQLTA